MSRGKEKIGVFCWVLLTENDLIIHCLLPCWLSRVLEVEGKAFRRKTPRILVKYIECQAELPIDK